MKKLLILFFILITINSYAVEKKTTFTIKLDIGEIIPFIFSSIDDPIEL